MAMEMLHFVQHDMAGFGRESSLSALGGCGDVRMKKLICINSDSVYTSIAAFMRCIAVSMRSSGAVMEIRTKPSPRLPKFVPGVMKTPVLSKSQLQKSREVVYKKLSGIDAQM